jgi:hypothetical protein
MLISSIQTNHLKKTFCLVVQVLKRFEATEVKSMAREQIVTVVRFLSLAEQILQWEHNIHSNILNIVLRTTKIVQLIMMMMVDHGDDDS